jgi:thiazole/oxazole-forming peptide maturase SagC family component
MDKIRIKPHYSTIVHNSNMVELRHGVWNSVSHMLNDENEDGILAKIIIGLNDQLSTTEIANQLSISRSKVESVLDYLQQLGVLQAKSESFVDYYVDNVIPTLKRPGKFKYEISKPIVLIGDQYINKKIQEQLDDLLKIEIIDGSLIWEMIKKSGDDWLYDALEQQKFIEKFESLKGKFVIFSSKHIDPILATRFNRIAYKMDIAWLHLAIDGPFIFVGPTFHGSVAPCFDCFETRVSMNLRESDGYQKYKNAIANNQIYTQDDDPLLSVTSNLLVTHATLEILNYLTTNCSFTTNKVFSIFLPTMEFIYHDLLRLPSCRTCGSVTHRDDTQLYFDFQKLVEEVA